MEFFFGVFDNDKDKENELPHLLEERLNIENALSAFDQEEEEEMRLEIRYNLGVSEFKRSLDRFASRMTIFHFSGHHGNGSIKLTDQKFNDLGLIDILNSSPQLKLVFLNGCITQEIAEKLSNVPIVIATTEKIEDKKAMELSSSFYKKLSNNIRNLRDPQKIKGFLTAALGGIQAIGSTAVDSKQAISRGGGNLYSIDYIFKIHEDIEDFPERVKYNIEIDDYPVSQNCELHINKWFGTKGIDKRKYFQQVYHTFFPKNFSVLLEDLTPSPYNQEDFTIDQTRFSQIKDLFFSLLLFFRHCGYSLIWDLLTQDINIIDASTKKKLKAELDLGWLICQPDDQKQLENRLILLKKIYALLVNQLSTSNGKILKKNAYFIKEVNNFLNDNEPLLMSYCKCFCISFKKNKKHNRFLLQSEEFLHFFINHCGFLSTYMIASVYGSSYYNYRTGEKNYEYKVRYFPKGQIEKPIAEMGNDNKYEVYSIILRSKLSNAEAKDCHINLSPFYIDINIGKEDADQINLHCLNFYDADAGNDYQPIVDLKEQKNTKDEQEENYKEEKVKVDKHLQEFIKKLA